MSTIDSSPVHKPSREELELDRIIEGNYYPGSEQRADDLRGIIADQYRGTETVSERAAPIALQGALIELDEVDELRVSEVDESSPDETTEPPEITDDPEEPEKSWKISSYAKKVGKKGLVDARADLRRPKYKQQVLDLRPSVDMSGPNAAREALKNAGKKSKKDSK